MRYLSEFSFPDAEREVSFIMSEKRSCFDSFYPFKLLSERGLLDMRFDAITILYGGNGSGKTTALNVIAEKLQLGREAMFNRSPFFEDYVRMCRYDGAAVLPPESRIITSDDVFDYMLYLRALNEGIDARREELFEEYLSDKYADFKYRTMEDYQKLKKVNMARRKTMSKYVRGRLMDNPREQSNGESAFFYFTNTIKDNALYLLDEPENSLSPQRQQELSEFLLSSARFFGCQFVIATHSPFMLSMKDARIYDMDADPARVRRWTELDEVRVYFDFFKAHECEFEDI